MVSNEKILGTLNALEQDLISLRRKIHEAPEIGGMELKTAALIKECAKQLQLPIIPVEGTGCVIVLETGRTGKRIALRADMDALPIQEAPVNAAGIGKRTVSQTEGVCHACGHDTHTAMLLTTMRALVELKDELSGTVYFCFEQGEENRSGYENMIKVLDTLAIDSVFAIHVAPNIESGMLVANPGMVTSGAIPVTITMHGKGGHSSLPEQCINPLIPAAEFVGAFYSAMGTRMKPGNSLIYCITSIQCGKTRNVIENDAVIQGSIRYFDKEEGRMARQIVRETADGIAGTYGCTAEVNPVLDVGYVPVENDAACVELFRKSTADILGEEYAPSDGPNMLACESFGYYTDKYSGIFVQLGVRNEGKGITSGLHTPKFDVDEDALIHGSIATVKYVAALMEV